MSSGYQVRCGSRQRGKLVDICRSMLLGRHSRGRANEVLVKLSLVMYHIKLTSSSGWIWPLR
jgi:hypothetical protein